MSYALLLFGLVKLTYIQINVLSVEVVVIVVVVVVGGGGGGGGVGVVVVEGLFYIGISTVTIQPFKRPASVCRE